MVAVRECERSGADVILTIGDQLMVHVGMLFKLPFVLSCLRIAPPLPSSQTLGIITLHRFVFPLRSSTVFWFLISPENTKHKTPQRCGCNQTSLSLEKIIQHISAQPPRCILTRMSTYPNVFLALVS